MPFGSSDGLSSAITLLSRDFTSSLVDGSDLAPIVARWEAVASELDNRRCTGQITPALATQAYTVAHNIASQGSAWLDLEIEVNDGIESVTTQLRDLLWKDNSGKRIAPHGARCFVLTVF